MARPIDEKIVVMKLDNSDFQRKATETTNIFGKLKQAMSNLTGVNLIKVSNEFGNIQRSVNGVNLSNLSQAVDAVTSRFSNLGIIATTALTNITNRAVDAGLRLTKSLGIDQVSSGFTEYELKMRSIGTILANTEWAGTNLTDVKKTLGELNDYADETIYSFEQMTANIGRFTAAGVTLEDSAIAIKGLGNLAAISGSDVNQLNTAMYQMSQALASGKLNLQDWNSLVNAGMAGKKTQDALVATAKAMGKNVDLSNGFRASIEKGWLTSEVFLETLKKFGADESMTEAATKVRTFTGMMDALKEGIGSGWAESWEIIFGDFEEATKFWTSISNVLNGIFDKQAEARNKWLSTVFDDGGLNKVLESVKNVAKPIIQLFGAMGDGFKKIFPPSGAEGIKNFISGLQNLTSSLKLSDKNVKNLETIFAGMFSILSSGLEILKAVGKAFLNIVPGVGALGTGILTLIANFFKLPIAFNESLKSGEALGKGTDILGKVFAGLSSVLKTVGLGFQNLSSIMSQAMSILTKGEFTGGFLEEDSKIVNVLFKLRDAFKSTFEYISSINISNIANGFLNFFKSIGDAFKDLKNTLAGIPDFFSNLFETISNNQGWILAGGGIAGLIAIGWKVFEFFDNITKPLAKFGAILEGAGDALGAFTLGIHVKSLLTIAIAVGVLAVSFKLLADLDSAQITNGLYMIVGSLTAMVGALTIMSKFDIAGSFSATLAIIGLAGAVFIMAGAIKKISDLNYKELTKGVIGLVAILGSLSGAIVVMNKYGGPQLAASAAQFVAIAASIHILLSAVKTIAEINTGDLIKGVTTLGIILAQLAIFVKIASGPQIGISAAGLVATAASVKIITSAIEDLARIDANALKQGLIAVGIVLGEVALFARLSANTGLATAGAGVLLIAAAINALVIPINLLGSMDLAVLAQGLIAIGVALGTIALASSFMAGIVPAAIGVGLLAVALTALVPPITALGLLPWDVLLKGIGGMVLALAAVAGTALLLAPASVPMLAFAAGLGILGAAMLLAGKGFALFGTGLLALSTLTVASVATIVATIGAMITGFGALLPAATDLVLKIATSVLEVINRMAPKLADAVAKLLLTLMSKITEYLPEFIKGGADILISFLDGFSEQIPRVTTSITNFVMTLVTNMTTTLRDNGPQFVNAMTELMGEILLVMITAGANVVKALFGWIPGVTEATEAIGKNAEKYIRENFKAKEAGEDKGKDFSTSLASTESLAQNAGKLIGEAGKSGAGSVDASTTGKQFGQGFANGISARDVFNNVVSAAKSLASAAYNAIKERLDINSPSREADELGRDTGQGFANGISKKEKEAAKAAKAAATAAVKEFGKRMDEAEYDFKMGTIDSNQYISEIEKIKGAYKKYPELVQKAELKIQAIRKEATDEAIKSLENQYQLGEITSAKYIEELGKMKEAYAKYPLEVQKIQLKINKAEEDAVKERAELRKQEFEGHKSVIENRQYYNRLSLAEELAIWEELRAKYNMGTEERKEADREVYRLKNEINSKLLALNDTYVSKIDDANARLVNGIKALNDEYDKAVIDRQKQLVSFVGIFDEVNKNSEVSGQQLIDRLRTQVMSFADWSNNIRMLAEKGIDKGLLEELRQMGPKAHVEIAALNTLTSEQLTEYSNLWKTKNEQARTDAIDELQDLRKQTDDNIKKLRTDTEKELEGYKKEWIKQIREIRRGTNDEYVKLGTSMKQIGEDTINGLMSGMNNKRGELMDLTNSIADEIARTIEKALKIKSPSRVTTEDGEFIGDGLINGMANRIRAIRKGAGNLASSITKSIDGIIEGYSLPDMHDAIHIKAVIDYDNSGFDRINKNLSLIPDTSFANRNLTAATLMKRQNENIYNNVPKVIKEQPQVNIEQKLEFHTRQMTPSEVARKNLQASRQLATQWGM